jgi:hypothetical protein
MAEPTLQQLFGANCTQDFSYLTISKQDIPGLTANSENTAESLLVGLVLLAGQYLTETNQETNPDIQVTITKGFDSLITRNNTNYRQYQYTIEMQKVDTATSINPADF